MPTIHITEKDYVDASRLFDRITKRRVLTLLAICAVSLLAALVLKTLSYFNAAVVVPCGTIGGCIGSEIGRWLWVPIRARQIYRQQRAIHEPIEFSWSDAGVSFNAPTGSSTTPWTHYRSFRESPTMFILLLTDTMYHMVPSTAFADSGERTLFRTTAKSHVRTKK